MRYSQTLEDQMDRHAEHPAESSHAIDVAVAGLGDDYRCRVELEFEHFHGHGPRAVDVGWAWVQLVDEDGEPAGPWEDLEEVRDPLDGTERGEIVDSYNRGGFD